MIESAISLYIIFRKLVKNVAKPKKETKKVNESVFFGKRHYFCTFVRVCIRT